jgi:hypothetical protein
MTKEVLSISGVLVGEISVPYGHSFSIGDRLFCRNCNPTYPAKVENNNTERAN